MTGIDTMVGKEELDTIFILKDLSEGSLNKIATVAERREFEKDTVIFEQGQELDVLYMLLNGKVTLNSSMPSGEILALDEVFPGRSFGLITLLGAITSSYKAVCTEKSSFLVLPSQRMIQLMESDKAFGFEIMLRVVQLYKSRMDKHTEQFLHSLRVHPDILKIS